MQVRFLHSMAGEAFYGVGDIADIPQDEAERLIVAGIAQPVAASEERAVAPAPEKRKK